jgi:hypothetical protein
MDPHTRGLLLDATQFCRTALEEEFSKQLEGTFDIFASGRIEEKGGSQLTPAERLIREKIVTAINHRQSQGEKPKDAVAGYLRECAFTFLNRLAALKMMEAREIVQECISKGEQSSGFKEFSGLAKGLIDLPDQGYRLYLECLFDEIGTEVGVLFDRRDPAALLWPHRQALKDVLEKLNGSGLSSAWGEDEAIGWLYQYFNSQQERDTMREKTVPENSYELAVRNQFFTPRYVVAFLTDNTLGRIWYEMTKGRTELAEKCAYMLRRPHERFLNPGQEPAKPATAEGLSVEEIINQPVEVLHRPLKDPREIRWIDPACGSMHFGLYAFDLFEVIYREAWDEHPDTLKDLREQFSHDRSAFLREVPRLILEHNLHGVDIDPRAAQIAQLALWLRAQRSWNGLGVSRSERPKIVRSNVVCAEALPDEPELLKAFQDDLSSPAIGTLVAAVIREMKIAGEAGSLLKIDETIKRLVREAKKRWQEGPKLEQARLFGDAPTRKSKQEEFALDFTGVTDETFWERAEGEIYRELRRYAAEASQAGRLGQRLFAEDVERGFALIDLLSKRFDVAVMNPPFGSFSKGYKAQAQEDYPNSYNDILAAFVDRMLDLLNASGRVGAITSRTCFYLGTLAKWRSGVLYKKCAFKVFADLGEQVMDEATVEAAAYCLEKKSPESRFLALRLLGESTRDTKLQNTVASVSEGIPDKRVFCPELEPVQKLKSAPLAYWVSRSALNALNMDSSFEPDVAQVRAGLTTRDNVRFVRGLWEIPSDSQTPAIAASKCATDLLLAKWVPLVSQGASQPWYSALSACIKWHQNGAEVRNYVGQFGSPSRWIASEDFYFRPGFSWTLRSVRFVPYTVPSGCIPTVSRYMAFPSRGVEFDSLAVSASNLATAYMRFYAEKFQWPKFLVEYLKRVPWCEPTDEWREKAESLIKNEVTKRRGVYCTQEPFREFTLPPYFSGTDITGALSYDPETLLGHELEVELAKTYGLSEEELADLERDMLEAIAANRGVSRGGDDDDDDEKNDKDFLIDTSEAGILRGLLSWLVGCAFGRWDIRFAKHPELAPDLGDVFDPLPVCEPGCLVNPLGLPAGTGQIVSEDWLRARPNAITMPPKGSVGKETIPDTAYPMDIPWDGILTEDEGSGADIINQIDSALSWIEGDHQAAETLEKAAAALKFSRSADFSIRDYFRNPNGFFSDHVGAYSKSKRKAPLYWAIATPSGSYTVWLYYFRCTGDTLFTALRDHARPKLKHEEGKLNRLVQEAGPTPAAAQRKEIDQQESHVTELRAFCQELERVAPLWKPHFDDGVIINYAPLWRLVAHKPWQKECKAMWDKLVGEEIDWAHLAMHLWPERVVPKCQTDLSLAIAHGLEDEFWFQDNEDNDKWKKRKIDRQRVEELIAERSSTAVKAAFEDLLSAPVPGGGKRKRKG